MKTIYRLTVDGLDRVGTALDLRALVESESLPIDFDVFCEGLAHLQMGLLDTLSHEKPFDTYSSFTITVVHDCRMHDFYTACRQLDGESKHGFRTCALRAAAIGIANSATEDEKLSSMLVHNFFLSI